MSLQYTKELECLYLLLKERHAALEQKYRELEQKYKELEKHKGVKSNEENIQCS